MVRRLRCASQAPLLVTVLAGCATSSVIDVSGIAEQDPLPYSVLVTGGAFVEAAGTAGGARGRLGGTFAGAEEREPLPLSGLAEALRSGRVFTRIVLDEDHPAALRARLAASRGGLPLEDPEVRGLLAAAREAGHDFLVVVQRLVDGPVEEYGVNDRWPLTVSLWLLVGLGVFIPDHTFESRATLQAAVFEVHTGRLVHRTVGGAGPVELALVGRGDAWSLVQSIVIPPFWVASDESALIAEMRRVTENRLLGSLARQLKSAACRQDLAEGSRATIDVVDRAVRVRSADALGAAALRVDGRVPPAAATEVFVRELLQSETRGSDGSLRYAAPLPDGLAGRYLQVLVRTVAGDVASVTLALGGR